MVEVVGICVGGSGKILLGRELLDFEVFCPGSAGVVKSSNGFPDELLLPILVDDSSISILTPNIKACYAGKCVNTHQC